MNLPKQNFQFSENIEQSLKSFQEYLRDYDKQGGFHEYAPETWVLDILYGLGLSLDPKGHKWASGAEKFNRELLAFLKERYEREFG